MLSGARPGLCFPKCFLSIEFLLLVNYYLLCLYQIVMFCLEISPVCWCRKSSETQARYFLSPGCRKSNIWCKWDYEELPVGFSIVMCILGSMIPSSMQEYLTVSFCSKLKVKRCERLQRAKGATSAESRGRSAQEHFTCLSPSAVRSHSMATGCGWRWQAPRF